jgi:tetratricopeptide (TPR) repeat protein
LARLLLVQGISEEATRSLEEAVRVYPDNVAASLSLGQIYYQKKDYAKAIAVYEKLVERRPHLWVAANDLAYILSEQAKAGSDLEKALALVQKARNIRPDAPSVMDTLGWIYYKKGEIDRAIEWIGRAQSKAPASGTINYHLGMSYYKAGKTAQAKEFLQRALASNEDFGGREEAENLIKRM